MAVRSLTTMSSNTNVRELLCVFLLVLALFNLNFTKIVINLVLGILPQKREISENPNFSNFSFLCHWVYLLFSFLPLPQKAYPLVLDLQIGNQRLR